MKRKVLKNPLIKLLADCVEQGYVVGGFVRDALLGLEKEVWDVDVVVPSWEVVKFKCLKEKLKVSPFVFKKEKTVYTFKTNSFRIDLTLLEGNSIEEDLRKRDFTINAMAISLKDILFADKEKLIDPLGGYDDLNRRLLRPVSKEALLNDPVRVLRGVRFKILFDFTYHPLFLEEAPKAAFLLKKIPPPRLKDELLKILPHSLFYRYLKELDALKALYHIFPELEGIEKIPPSGLHQFDLKTHTFLTVKYLETLCSSIPLKEKIGNDFPILKLVALYHDVAKPLTVKEKDGYLTFYNHDKIGAEITKKAFERLTLGKKASQMAWTIVRNHLRPFFLYELFKKNKLTQKAVFKLYKDTKPYHYHVLLHSLADYSATSKEMAESAKEFLNFLFLLSKNFESFEQLKPLLNGKDIMEIKGFSSPNSCIGKIKDKLEELQAVGKVRTKEEAVKFVKGYCCG